MKLEKEKLRVTCQHEIPRNHGLLLVRGSYYKRLYGCGSIAERLQIVINTVYKNLGSVEEYLVVQHASHHTADVFHVVVHPRLALH